MMIMKVNFSATTTLVISDVISLLEENKTRMSHLMPFPITTSVFLQKTRCLLNCATSPQGGSKEI